MMPPLSTQERLATLQSLLERQNIYQRRFARAALIGGTLSILTAAALFTNDGVVQFVGRPVRPREFGLIWLIVLALTVVAGGLLSVQSEPAPGQVAGGKRTKLALGAIAPYLLIPGAFTAWFFGTGYLGGTELDLVEVWIAFYGLMLVSTAAFAPRSLVLFGWAFLLTAVGVPLLQDKLDLWIADMPSLLMGVSFGFYHVIYALFHWRR